MTSHELARILLANEDLPVASHANNHTASSIDGYYRDDGFRVCELIHYLGRHIVIGNVSKKNINSPNWYVSKELDGGRELPQEWK